MNYAVNVDAIIDSMFGGYAHREATCVHPWVFGFNPDVKPYSEDLDKAKKLLAEAGYPDGFKIDFEVCPAVGDLYNMEVSQIIVEQLKRVGIEVNLMSVEYGVMRRKVYGDRTVVPMFRWMWKTWYNDPDGVMYGFFHSESIGAFVKNPELDKMIMDARFNLDQAEREAIYKRLQEYVKEEAYHIALYYLDTIYGVSSQIDWEPRADARLYFYEVKTK
jgi:peptide/nickel transport system substrate-binding protein